MKRKITKNSDLPESKKLDKKSIHLESSSDKQSLQPCNDQHFEFQGIINKTFSTNSHINCLTTLPNSHLIATASENSGKHYSIHLWTLDGQRVRTLDGHTKQIMCLVSLPNSGNLASGSDDSSLKIWDPLSGELLHTLVGHEEEILSIVVFSDDRLASSSMDSSVKIWTSRGGELLRTFKTDEPILSMAVSSDDAYLALLLLENNCERSTIKLVDTKNGDELRTVVSESCFDNSVIQNNFIVLNNEMVVYNLKTKSIEIRSLEEEKGKLLKAIKLVGQKFQICSMILLPDRMHLACASIDGHIYVCNLKSGAKVKTVKSEHYGCVHALAVLGDGGLVSANFTLGVVNVWK
jgi:WD40 repeat protein